MLTFRQLFPEKAYKSALNLQKLSQKDPLGHLFDRQFGTATSRFLSPSDSFGRNRPQEPMDLKNVGKTCSQNDNQMTESDEKW